MARNCLVINLDRCFGCHSCEIACKNEHDIPLGEYWNRIIEVGPTGTFPKIEQYFLPIQCQQCENAPCQEICPTGATFRAEDGTVQINQDECIGCQACIAACPYGTRTFRASSGTVFKCTLCEHRDEPKCAANCPGRCRIFGDLDDPESAASKALAEADPACVFYFHDEGNAPRTAYILSPKYASWVPEDQLVMDNPAYRHSIYHGLA